MGELYPIGSLEYATCKVGEIIVSASYDEEANLQINPAVTLVTLGDSLDWQLPSKQIFIEITGNKHRAESFELRLGRSTE
jgi:hypothetical protein